MQPHDLDGLTVDVRNLLQTLPNAQREALMVGAIPHWLDTGVVERLFAEQSDQNLKLIAELHFLRQGQFDQFFYPSSVRNAILKIWKDEDPVRFRQISSILAQEFLGRLKKLSSILYDEQPDRSFEFSAEWLFHTTAEEPAYGMVLVTRLFQQLLEGFEIGRAERLVHLIEEQKPWLGEQFCWLAYFPPALALCQYKKVNLDEIKNLQEKHPDTSLAAAILCLRGDQAVQNSLWDQGRDFYEEALQITRKLGEQESEALINVHLGNLYRFWAESSGGILIEERKFVSWFHELFYSIVHGPLLLYESLANHINALPNLYGGSYQNWVAERLMDLSLKSYRRAEQHFRKFGNQGGLAKLAGSMGKLLLDLKYPDSARHLGEAALKRPSVAASPYYRARVEAIIADSDPQPTSDSLKVLNNSLDQLEHYRDWVSAKETALALANRLVLIGENDQAVDTYGRCLEFARCAKDILLQTEVARRLNTLAASLPLGETAKKAALLRDRVHRRAYINRYPGPVHAAFRKLAYWLAYPSMFLFFLLIIISAGITISIIEGEFVLGLRIPNLSDWLQLSIGLLMPLLMIWGYRILYVLLGKVMAKIMPLPRVGESQPELYVIDEIGMVIRKKMGEYNEIGGGEYSKFRWRKPSMILFNNLSFYRQPLTFSARAILHNCKEELSLPASIYHYTDLCEEITRLFRGRIVTENLSVLRTRWLAVSIFAGIFLAAANLSGWFWAPLNGCFWNTPNADPTLGCPPGHELYFQFSIQAGLLFASLVFVLVTIVRWWLVHRTVAKVLCHGRTEIRGI